MNCGEKSNSELNAIKYLADDIAEGIARQRAIASDNRGYYGSYGYVYNGIAITSANSKAAIKRKIVLLRSMLLELSKEIK